MEGWIAGVVASITVAIVAAELAKGGLRRRALTSAKIELEVAGTPGLTDVRAGQLRESADRRVARYLRRRVPASDKLPRRLAIGAIATDGMLALAILLIGIIAVARYEPPTWLLLGVSAAVGITIGLTDGPVTRLLVWLHERELRAASATDAPGAERRPNSTDLPPAI